MDKQAMIDAIKSKEAKPLNGRFVDPQISACMIVADEGMYIYQVLEAVSQFVDEVVVCDTGSVDNTIAEIERAIESPLFGHKIVLDTGYTWNDDFSEARMYSVSKAKHDWVFIIDGHEIIKGSPDCLKQEIRNCIIEEVAPDGMRMPFVDVRNGQEYSRAYTNIRLAQKDKMNMHEPIHNQIIVKTYKVMSLATIYHIGYGEDNVIQKEKRDKRNKQTSELLTKKINSLLKMKNTWNDEDKKSYGYMCHQFGLLEDGFFGRKESAEKYYIEALKYKEYYSPDVANNTYSAYVRLLAQQNRDKEMFDVAFDALKAYKYNIDVCYILGMRFWELQDTPHSIIALQNYFYCLTNIEQQNETTRYHEKDFNFAAFILLTQCMATGVVLNDASFEALSKKLNEYSVYTRVMMNYMHGTREHMKKEQEEKKNEEAGTPSTVGQDAELVQGE